MHGLYTESYISSTQSADRAVSSFVDSSAQHRGNEAESDSNGNKNTCSSIDLTVTVDQGNEIQSDSATT